MNYGNMCMNPYILNSYPTSSYLNREKGEILNIKFYFGGQCIGLLAKKNTKFFDLCQRFCNHVYIKDIEESIYIINGQKIDFKDNTTLAELNIRNNCKILVGLSSKVIGL